MKELKWVLIVMWLAAGVYWASDRYVHSGLNEEWLNQQPDEVNEEVVERVLSQISP